MQKILHILAHMGAARAYGAASHAKRRKVGAVITFNGSPVACGWNGTPPGYPNQCETDDGSATLPTVVHAEPNALAKLKGLQLVGPAEMFVTCLPCPDCAKLIAANARIKRVFFGEVYRSLEGAKTLLDSGVELFYVHERCEQLYRVTSVVEDSDKLKLAHVDSSPRIGDLSVDGEEYALTVEGFFMSEDALH